MQKMRQLPASLVPDLFLFFKKALHDLKPSGLQQLNFNIGEVLILTNTAQ